MANLTDIFYAFREDMYIMSENCSHNCSGCGSKGTCSSNNGSDTHGAVFEKSNRLSDVKKLIGVVSGKGGVGKSLVTSMLAVLMQRRGLKTAILDADITGPSIPKVFGINSKADVGESGIVPAESKSGIRIMSVNLLLENENEPVIWRGPVISGAVRQFWTDVAWGNVDCMIIDMPPGTGDVPLTVFQSLPVDGIVIVSSPQELVGMIVSKAVKMADSLKIPIVGLVENMSYFQCPSCNDKHNIFGRSNVEELASMFGIEEISKIPVNPKLTELCDNGFIESFEGCWLDNIADKIEKLNSK